MRRSAMWKGMNLLRVLSVLFFMSAANSFGALTISNIKVTDLTDKRVIISWTTDIQADGRVHYGTDKDNLSLVRSDIRNGGSYYNHYVEITGLNPDTTYYYRVESNSVRSPRYSFHTPQETTVGLSYSIGGHVFDRNGEPAEGGIVYLTLKNWSDVVPVTSLIGWELSGGGTWQQRSDTSQWNTDLQPIVRGDIRDSGATVLNTYIQNYDVANGDQIDLFVRGPTPEDGTYSDVITATGSPQTVGDISLPVFYSSIIVSPSSDGVILRWSVASHVDNLGWYIYRKGEGESDFEQITDKMILDDPLRDDYAWIDRSHLRPGRYFYVIESVDIAGNRVKTDPIPVIVLARKLRTELLQNYPNPCNPETWIPFRLGDPGEVRIRIYNSSGALIREISLGRVEAGEYISKDRAVHWDGRDYRGEIVPSGLYFYEMEVGRIRFLRKMTLLK